MSSSVPINRSLDHCAKILSPTSEVSLHSSFAAPHDLSNLMYGQIESVAENQSLLLSRGERPHARPNVDRLFGIAAPAGGGLHRSAAPQCPPGHIQGGGHQPADDPWLPVEAVPSR